MKMRLLKFVIVGVLVFTCQASASFLGISSVTVIPNQPISTDLITFNIMGGASSSASWVDHDQFLQNDTSLQLDLYVDTGITTMPSFWTYSKQISLLLPETYTLTVNAFFYKSGELQDTHVIDFTVVPEPGTLVVLGFALSIMRVFTRRKR